MALKISGERLSKLQQATPHIRNISIIAHVDHGKTTLTDCLLSSNGIISEKLAGKLRYMDHLEDEQARGITMKSSAISLLHYDRPHRRAKRALRAKLGESTPLPDSVPYLVHLVDTPGHVDFSADVSTAVRVCDGAVVVIDAVEGVCIQTRAVMRAAYREGLRLVLVINKCDRLITELRLSPAEAFDHLSRIIESANAIASVLYAEERFAAAPGHQRQHVTHAGDAPAPRTPAAESGAAYGDDAVSSDDEDDDDDEDMMDAAARSADAGATVDADERVEARLLFDPIYGNVVFASAIHHWAFTVDDFAAAYAERLGLAARDLRAGLWGPFAFDAKSKRVVPIRTAASSAVAGGSATSSKLVPMAVDMILTNLWKVYETAMDADSWSSDPDKAEKRLGKMIKALGIEAAVEARMIAPRVEPAVRVQAVMRAWLPLARCVLGAVTRHVPCPQEAAPRRIDRLLPRPPRSAPPALRTAMLAARAAVEACSPSVELPVIAIVSKVVAVARADMPETPAGMPTARAATSAASFEGIALRPGMPVAIEGEPIFPANTGTSSLPVADSSLTHTASAGSAEEDEFVCFVRVLCGTLRPDTPIFVLGPRYDPVADPARFDMRTSHDADRISMTADVPTIMQPRSPLSLFLMMSRELAPLTSVPAGNVAAVGGLGACVLRSATLSTTPAVPALAPLTLQTTPLVRVSIEPRRVADALALERGLRLLEHADPCVELSILSSGEMQIACLGPLHLERCVSDLRKRFAAGVDMIVSEPIVPFRETICAAARPRAPRSVREVAGSAADDSSDADDADSEASFGEFEDNESASGPATGSRADVESAAAPTSSAVDPVVRMFSAGAVTVDPSNATVVAVTSDGRAAVRVRVVPIPSSLLEIASSLRGERLFSELAEGQLAEAEDGSLLSPAARKTFESLQGAARSAGAVWERRVASIVASASACWLCSEAPAASARFGGGGIVPSDLNDSEPSPWISLMQPFADGETTDADRNGGIRLGWSPPLLAASDMRSSDMSLDSVLSQSARESLMSSVVQGFRLAMAAGPLCAEPVWGVCVCLMDVMLRRSMESPTVVSLTPSPGVLIGATKEACSTGLRHGSMRLVEGILRCQLTCSGGRLGGSGEQMGNLYAVLSKRRGTVEDERLLEGTETFIVDAMLPMASAYGFADELRARTSGAATSPQLVFSHWAVIPEDPFFQPKTDEQREELGDRVHEGQARNLAKELVDAVRVRKGLAVHRKVVIAAEKQRTRSRKK